MRDLVETQYLDLQLPEEGLELSSGKRLSAVRIAYETHGVLAESADNVVFICHALTGDSHCAGYHSDDPKSRGWWEPHPDSDQPRLIGVGAAIDTKRFYVVCANILGGCAGTTGPKSNNPETGEPYGIEFPLVTIKDVVRVQRLLLDQLGVKRLHAVVGGSMGGMQALEWAISFPEYVARCACIATAASLSPQALAFDIIGRQEIENDPNWNGGHYYGQAIPRAGLSRARQIGHVTYLSDQSMYAKFGRDEHDRPRPEDSSKFSTSFEVESYLNYNGNSFVDRFDANSYLYISRMMDMFDLAKEHGSLREALAKTASKFLIISIESDWLFPPPQQLELLHELLALRREVSYLNMNSHFGHDAFLIEYDLLCPALGAFLTGEEPRKPAPVNRQDLNVIKSMVPRGERILDLGAGEGNMMLAVQRATGSTGIC
ncbi:MAG TPA: homoserine O-acetyltransferase, partial [Lentisphaeria bacterium]|nr:homoserine O-acetyltransferase [Lentisphaeria bacterium]